jgi:DNA-binding MarR family transcriptional regulator
MHVIQAPPATTTADPKPELCNCLALRQAARHVTQFYDGYLAAADLRTTQFSILIKLKRMGPLTINALASHLVMDRTTLGRNIRPLEREGLIVVRTGQDDRRSKELHLTAAGAARLRTASRAWAEAQKRFEAVFGRGRASEMRGLLRDVTASKLSASEPVASGPSHARGRA